MDPHVAEITAGARDVEEIDGPFSGNRNNSLSAVFGRPSLPVRQF